MEEGYLVLKRGSRVIAIQSVNRPCMFGFSRGGQ